METFTSQIINNPINKITENPYPQSVGGTSHQCALVGSDSLTNISGTGSDAKALRIRILQPIKRKSFKMLPNHTPEININQWKTDIANSSLN
jgi:hypothetical protein